MGDRVLTTVRLRARGRFYEVYELSEGKIARMDEFTERPEALEAAGPRDQRVPEDDPALTFRRSMEAYSRGDYEAAVAGFDPEIEWSVDESIVPDATTYHGHEGVKRFWDTWAEVISGMRLEIEECRRIDRDRVFSITRAHGTGAGSGAPVDSRRFAQIAEFRDGRAVKVGLYSVGHALKLVGLRD